MLKRTLCGAALMLALLATGCGDANQNLPQIDVRTDYPEREICLQDVAEVNYIQLETTDESVYDGAVNSFTGERIVVQDAQNYRLLFFDKQGNYLSSINRKGQGPEEYTMMLSALMDWDREEVFVIDGRSKIVVYSLDGTFKRKLDLDSALGQHDTYIWSDGQLISYLNGLYDKEGKLIPFQPIALLSKEDGTMDSLSYRKEHAFPTYIGQKDMRITFHRPSLAKLNGDIYVNDLSADTIYRLDVHTRKLQPMMTRTPSVTLDDLDGFFMDLLGITPQFYLLNFCARQASLDSNFVVVDEKSKYAIYDREDGKVYHPKFTNKDYASMEECNLQFVDEEKYCAVMQLQAFDLIEALKAGELNGELKTIAEGLKEDDNPVLMVVKFKE